MCYMKCYVFLLGGREKVLVWFNSSHLDKMAAILQAVFSDAFSWMELLHFDQNITEVYS